MLNMEMFDEQLSTYWALQSRYRQGAKKASPDERRQMQRELRQIRNRVVAKLGQQWLLSLAKEPAGLRDWFWFNHFNVYAAKGHVGALLPYYLAAVVFGQRADKFADRLIAAITHPAMQVYLDNVRNVKGRGNENLARELLELHTLGVQGGYTQADVQAAAKVLSGWGLDEAAPEQAFFNPQKHEAGRWQVMGWAWASAGSAGAANGRAQLLELLQWLAAQPATALHLARKCCWWALSDAPTAAELAQVQAAYLHSGGSVQAVWQAVDALAAARLAAGQAGVRLKAPMTYVVQALGILVQHNPAQGERMAAQAMRWLRQLGQPLFGRTSPDGYPLRGQDWLSSGQLAQRFALAQEIAATLPDALASQAAKALAEQMAAQKGALALSAATRTAAFAAEGGRAQLALLLASPEFMSEAG